MSFLRLLASVLVVLALSFRLAGAAERGSKAASSIDRKAVRATVRRLAAARPRITAKLVLLPGTIEAQVKQCQAELDLLVDALNQCVTANSDPESPPAGSPLDEFNKLTNAQLAQKCKGTLEACINQVLAQQWQWCRHGPCKAQTDAVDVKKAACQKLQQQLAQQKKKALDKAKKKALAGDPSSLELKNKSPQCQLWFANMKMLMKQIDAIKKAGKTPPAWMEQQLKSIVQQLIAGGCV